MKYLLKFDIMEQCCSILSRLEFLFFEKNLKPKAESIFSELLSNERMIFLLCNNQCEIVVYFFKIVIVLLESLYDLNLGYLCYGYS